jgi:hypothetical protein
MESNSNSIIPTDLVGTWGYYVNKFPNKCLRINADGSGYLFTISHEVKWSVSENRLDFFILTNDCPASGSAQYSIIDRKLSFSVPFLGDIGNHVFGEMMSSLPGGLDKIMDKS